MLQITAAVILKTAKGNKVIITLNLMTLMIMIMRKTISYIRYVVRFWNKKRVKLLIV